MVYQALITTAYIGMMLVAPALSAEAIVASEENAPKTIYVQDRYGNTTGIIKRTGNNYYEADRYGNVERVYKKSGDTTYIYDRYGNCIGRFKKGTW